MDSRMSEKKVTRGRWIRRAVPFVVGAVVAVPLVVSGASAAGAAPVTPPAPEAPRVIFEEGFETGVAADAISVDAYTGADGTQYTADAYWLDHSICNGVIVQAEDTVFPGGWCPSAGPGAASDPKRFVRALASSLGTLNGAANPDRNHAVAAYTNGTAPTSGAGVVALRSLTPVAEVQAGRFYVASIDLAEVNCHATDDSRYQIGISQGSVDRVLNSTPFAACDDGADTQIDIDGTSYAVKIGKFFTPGFLAEQTGDVSVFVKNLQTGGAGNDAAYDNVRLYDATPSVSKSFEKDAVETGVATPLTFTVTNTTDRQAKSGWSFTDNLPAGMVVANAPNIVDDCGADITASAGASSIAIADGTIGSGVASCTITVNVVLNAGGAFENVIEGAVGLDGEPRATIQGLVPSIAVVKSADAKEVAAPGQKVTYSFVVTNTGGVDLHDVKITDPGPIGGTGTMGAIDCAGQTQLPVGKSITCTAVYTAAAGDLTGVDLANTETVKGLSPAGKPVTADDSATLPSILAAPALSLVKSADATTASTVGQKITYSFLVTNTGNVDVTDVTVTEGAFSGKGKLSEVECPADADVLAPGEEVTCTAVYTVVAGDLTGQPITNTATADGIGPDGKPVASPKASASVTTVAPATPKPAGSSLATTGGADMTGFGIAALVMVAAGAGALAVRRRRA